MSRVIDRFAITQHKDLRGLMTVTGSHLDLIRKVAVFLYDYHIHLNSVRLIDHIHRVRANAAAIAVF